MRGELDFQQSFRHRVGLLKGLPVSQLQQVVDEVPLMDGAERLVATLRRLGYKTAILSGGFTFMGEALQRRLGIDYLHANELDVADVADARAALRVVCVTRALRIAVVLEARHAGEAHQAGLAGPELAAVVAQHVQPPELGAPDRARPLEPLGRRDHEAGGRFL